MFRKMLSPCSTLNYHEIIKRWVGHKEVQNVNETHFLNPLGFPKIENFTAFDLSKILDILKKSAIEFRLSKAFFNTKISLK